MNKIRFFGACGALGALVVLGGCVAVPSGPGYSDGGYGGYYSGYPEPIYSSPGPVYVAPPVYFNGGYSSGPRYWGGGRPGYHGGQHPGYGPRHGFVPRPGHAAPPVALPRPGFVPRAAVPVVPVHPGRVPRQLLQPLPSQSSPGGS